MTLKVNGETREVVGPVSVAEYLASLDLNPKMVVVEHNRVIVARDRYDTTKLSDGDELEIVQMMAGG